MKTSVCIASLCLGVLTSGALAADVNVRGALSETLDGSDNYFLSNSPTGATFKSLSAFNLDVLARTPGWRYLLSSNVSYYNYFGDGADATSPTQGTPINETFRIDHATDLARYYFTTTWNRADIASTQLRESGVVTGSGTLDTVRASGGGSYDINRLDSISWSAQAAHTSFTNSTQTPFSDYGAFLSWNHLLDPRTSLITSVTFDWYDASDLVNSQRLFWQIMTGVHSQLTHRLTVDASVGASFANAYQNNPVTFAAPTTFTQSGAGSGWVAQGSMTYQLLRTTTVSASAANLIVPTSFGQLQRTETASLGLSHDINSRSHLAFSANFAHTSANSFLGGTNADFFSAQAAYSYQLTRDWSTRFSYTFRQRDDDTGSARANVFLVSLRYNFNLLGKPSVFDPVDAERGLLRQQRAIGEVFPMLQ